MIEIADLTDKDRLPSVPEELASQTEKFGTVVNLTSSESRLSEWDTEIKKYEAQGDLVVRLTDAQKLRILRIASDTNQSPQDVIDVLIDKALEGAIGRPMINKPSWASSQKVTGYSPNSNIKRVDS